MRVITYVPPVHGAARTRRAVEREVRRQGHEIVGHTDSSTEARAALSAGVADIIAGRPEHLLDLAPWALGVTSRAATVRHTAAVLPVWAATQARQHPVRAATVCAALAGLAAAALLAGPDQPRRHRPTLLPPPTPPSATAPYRTPPASAPPSRRPTPSPDASAAGLLRPTLAGVPVSSPAPAPPAESSAPVQPPTMAPGTAPATPPSTPPTATPTQPPGCLITLDTPILDLRVCLGHLSS